jgi:hypothetical protein
VRRLLAAFLLSAAGCAGFEPPTPAQLRLLDLPKSPGAEKDEASRLRVRVGIDSPWLAGEFDGVVLVKDRATSPVVRIQLFGDVGPKTVDLTARRDRIVGYFPQTREGVDCALPREASRHVLLFLGASLLERFTPKVAGHVEGVREEDGGLWFRLSPAVEGMTSDVFRDRHGALSRWRFSWMAGIGWEEERIADKEIRITAPRMSIRVRILEQEDGVAVKAGAMDLTLPAEVRIVEGSRK